MDVARFLKQTASIERRSTSDAYSGDSYAAAATIDVRWHTEDVVILSDQGRTVTSTAHISTLAEVSVGDRVTDEEGRARQVVQVRKNRAVDGVFSHYVAYLL